jgi:hypothetical protein
MDTNTMATKAINRDARSVEIRQWWSVTLDMDGLRRLLMDARTLEALQHQRLLLLLLLLLLFVVHFCELVSFVITNCIWFHTSMWAIREF